MGIKHGVMEPDQLELSVKQDLPFSIKKDLIRKYAGIERFFQAATLRKCFPGLVPTHPISHPSYLCRSVKQLLMFQTVLPRAS